MFAAAQMSRRHSTMSATLPSSSVAYGTNGYGFPVVDDIDRSSVCTTSTGASEDLYYKDKPRREPDNIGLSHILLAAMSMLLLVWTMHCRAQRAWLLRELQVQSFQEAVGSFHELKDEHDEAFEELEYHYSRNERLEQRDAAWLHQVGLLQNFTQRESWRAVMDKYGPGPHRVQFSVQLSNAKVSSLFEVEMAPINLVPHAVHLFLEQVSHGLWNNSVFQVNREHVIQAGPSSKEHRQNFKEYELDRLAFPEYSEDFPHKKWTLGFAGRPGGPSWYINKIDNEEDHGPFGQEHHALDEYADSCFARILNGFDVLEEVFKQKVGERTKIVSATIVGWEDHWSYEDDEEWHHAHEEYAEDHTDSADDDWLDNDNSNENKSHLKRRNADGFENYAEILPDGSYIVKDHSSQ